MKVVITQLCLTVCDPTYCSRPGSSVHGISQARILEWVAIPFSRGSYQLRYGTRVSFMAGRFFTLWVTREALPYNKLYPIPSIINIFHEYSTFVIINESVNALLLTNIFNQILLVLPGIFFSIPRLMDHVTLNLMSFRAPLGCELEKEMEKEMITHSSTLVWKIPCKV